MAFEWAQKFADNFFETFADTTHKLVKAKAAIWLGRLLSAVGLGFVAQKFIYDPMIEYAQQAWSQLPAMIGTWVHALGLDTAVSIILSAYGIRGAERIFVRRENNAT
jgi:hypothetical protein